MQRHPQSPSRIASLDLLRGVAVMGILVANLPGFALPEAAYLSPLAWGGSTGVDRWAWVATFVLVEGKLRALFSVLFGASMLLVIDRAEAAGENPAAVHLRRMAALFAIGLLHLYALWWGDILTHYALVGALAYPFARLPVRTLLAIGAGLVAVQTVMGLSLWLSAIDAAARATPAAAAAWAGLQASFGTPPAADLAAEVAAGRGGYAVAAAWRWRHAVGPLDFLPFGGTETLGYMLFGMAGLRSGFLAGAWPRRRYVRWAALALAPALLGYAALAAATLRHGFDIRYVILGSVGLATPLRPVAAVGFAALVLAVRRDGWLTHRIAATGRTAFTNYLGTTIVMTVVFQQFGLFGQVPRAALYLFAVPSWAVMIAWSQPWLARYRFGPLEWLWRSLARGTVQPMRGPAR